MSKNSNISLNLFNSSQLKLVLSCLSFSLISCLDGGLGDGVGEGEGDGDGLGDGLADDELFFTGTATMRINNFLRLNF